MLRRFLFIACGIVFFVGFYFFEGRSIVNSDIYWFVGVGLAGVLVGVFFSCIISLDGWDAIFMVLIFLSLGLILSGVLFIDSRKYSLFCNMFLSFVSTFCVSVASATISNHHEVKKFISVLKSKLDK